MFVCFVYSAILLIDYCDRREREFLSQSSQPMTRTTITKIKIKLLPFCLWLCQTLPCTLHGQQQDMSNGGECKKQTGEWCCQAVGCAAAAVVVDTRCMCCCRLCNSVLLESSQLTSVCCCCLLLLFVLFTFLFSLFISLLEISCFCLGFLAPYTCKICPYVCYNSLALSFSLRFA